MYLGMEIEFPSQILKKFAMHHYVSNKEYLWYLFMTNQIVYSGPPLVDHAPNRRSGAHGSASTTGTTGQVTAASSNTCKNPTTPGVWPPESNSMDWGFQKAACMNGHLLTSWENCSN